MPQLINIPCHIQNQSKFVVRLPKLTITMINKVTIGAQKLRVMQLLGLTVRIVSAVSWDFPVHNLTKLLNLLKLLLFNWFTRTKYSHLFPMSHAYFSCFGSKCVWSMGVQPSIKIQLMDSRRYYQYTILMEKIKQRKVCQ